MKTNCLYHHTVTCTSYWLLLSVHFILLYLRWIVDFTAFMSRSSHLIPDEIRQFPFDADRKAKEFNGAMGIEPATSRNRSALFVLT